MSKDYRLTPEVALFWAIHQPGARPWEDLRTYLLHAPEKEAWLFLRLLAGYYWYPRTPSRTLLKLAARFAGLPEKLLLYAAQEAGDTAEALTLVLIPPDRPPIGFPESLEHWLLYDLPALLRSEERLISALPPLWETLAQKEAFFLHKVLLQSAHLPALRRKQTPQQKSDLLLSLLRLRWPFPIDTLRTSLIPPAGPAQPTLF
jgi:hypothetical protein